MTLAEIFRLVDQLSPEERRQVRAYIDEREQETSVGTLTPEERWRRLEAGFAALREGMTQDELDELTEAMNAEYIEAWDESEWRE